MGIFLSPSKGAGGGDNRFALVRPSLAQSILQILPLHFVLFLVSCLAIPEHRCGAWMEPNQEPGCKVRIKIYNLIHLF